MNLYIPVLSLNHHGGVKVLCELADYIYESNDSKLSPILICPKGLNDSTFIKNQSLVKELGFDFRIRTLNQLIFIVLVTIYLSKNKGIYVANFFITWYPAYIARLINGSRIIYFIQGQDDSFKGPLGRVLNILCKITFLYKKQCFLPANSYLKNVFKIKYGIKSIIPDFNVGLHNDFFLNRHEELTLDRQYDFCFFGRSEPWKRIDRFFDLLSFINNKKTDVSILFISKDKKAIASTISKASNFSLIKIDFVSSNTNYELCGFLKKCKYLVGTSELEGFYLPPLEAMSQGVYPLIYDCGGPRTYINSDLVGKFVTNEEDIYKCIFLGNKINNHSEINLMMHSKKFNSAQSYSKFCNFIV